MAKEYFSVSFIDKILSNQVSVSFFLISKEDKNIVHCNVSFFIKKCFPFFKYLHSSIRGKKEK